MFKREHESVLRYIATGALQPHRGKLVDHRFAGRLHIWQVKCAPLNAECHARRNAPANANASLKKRDDGEVSLTRLVHSVHWLKVEQ